MVMKMFAVRGKYDTPPLKAVSGKYDSVPVGEGRKDDRDDGVNEYGYKLNPDGTRAFVGNPNPSPPGTRVRVLSAHDFKIGS